MGRKRDDLEPPARDDLVDDAVRKIDGFVHDDSPPLYSGPERTHEPPISTIASCTLESITAFLDSIGPYHFAPSHMHLFDRVLKASSFTIEMMQHFMSTIAPSYDLRPSLERITAPTLVMVGRYDWVCPPRASRAIARGIPGAQLVEFDNAGHMVFSEEPAQFLDAMTCFLAAHASAYH